MINLEQVKLLETKVAKAIDYIEHLTGENAAHLQKTAELQAKVDSYQGRIGELEVLIMGFKEDQSRIEDSILAALDRLNQFEEAIEKSLAGKPDGKDHAKTAAKPAKAAQKPDEEAILVEAVGSADSFEDSSADATICFEIPETENGDDILDPLSDTLDDEPQTNSEELDIF
jgi:FtsZ-binding cell division protein ZapB